MRGTTEEFGPELDELVREGARQMLLAALVVEVAKYNERKRLRSLLSKFKTVGFGDERELMIRHLRDFFEATNRHEIRACVMFGTLLGKLRHNDFIPWDDDADVVVFSYDLFLERCAPELEAMGYVVLPDIRDGKRMGCRVFHRDNLEIRGEETLRFPWIGIWEHEMRGTDCLTLPPENFEYAMEDFFPLKHVEFFGFLVAIPHRPESVLDTYFGSQDWMEYCVLPKQDHRSGGVATNFPTNKFKVCDVLDHLSRTKA